MEFGVNRISLIPCAIDGNNFFNLLKLSTADFSDFSRIFMREQEYSSCLVINRYLLIWEIYNLELFGIKKKFEGQCTTFLWFFLRVKDDIQANGNCDPGEKVLILNDDEAIETDDLFLFLAIRAFCPRNRRFLKN
jgi:hypothetical protein